MAATSGPTVPLSSTVLAAMGVELEVALAGAGPETDGARRQMRVPPARLKMVRRFICRQSMGDSFPGVDVRVATFHNPTLRSRARKASVGPARTPSSRRRTTCAHGSAVRCEQVEVAGVEVWARDPYGHDRLTLLGGHEGAVHDTRDGRVVRQPQCDCGTLVPPVRTPVP